MSPITAVELAKEANAILDAIERVGRQPTADESEAIGALLDAAEQLGEVKTFPAGSSPNVSPMDMSAFQAGWPTQGGAQYVDPGARFVGSEAYKSLFAPGRSRPQQWSTGPIPITDGPPMMQLKGTLVESAGGNPWVATPQVVPGAVVALFQPLAAETVLSAGVATGSTVRYIVEGTATSAAAGVLEGGSKPESTIGFTYADEPIRKVATFLPLSDEMIEDAPSIQGFVNQQLMSFVNIEVERQLLRGTASGAEIQGLLTGRSVPVYSGGTAAGNKAEQLFKAMNSMRGSAYIEPDWVLINPSDYEAIRLLKDDSGQLYGGGPFFGPYGNSGPAAASGQITGAVDSLWSKPCYVTSSLGSGTAVIGTRAGAAVWSRGGISVEATNAHSDFFQRDLVAIRSERRLGLAVYRSKAFVECRLS